MRFAIRLLLTVCLIWCGLHLAEPAEAHAVPGGVSQLLDAGCEEPSGDSERASHVHHHHCPVAGDPRAGSCDGHLRVAVAEPFAGQVAQLRSLSRAPPLQPPSA